MGRETLPQLGIGEPDTRPVEEKALDLPQGGTESGAGHV